MTKAEKEKLMKEIGNAIDEMEKIKEVAHIVREPLVNLNVIDFLSIMCGLVDDYCDEHNLDVKMIADKMNEAIHLCHDLEA